MQPTSPTNRMFRAEKSNPNRDDFRVLMAGIMLTITGILVIPVVGSVYDKAFAERPFVTATIEVIESNDYTRPMLYYDADATQPVDATWIAIIRDENGSRLSTRRGQGSYETKEDNAQLWTWAAFFDTETGTPLPDVPDQAFKVCLRYVSAARDSGVFDETPEHCSTIFYPEGVPIGAIITEGEMP